MRSSHPLLSIEVKAGKRAKAKRILFRNKFSPTLQNVINMMQLHHHELFVNNICRKYMPCSDWAIFSSISHSSQTFHHYCSINNLSRQIIVYCE